jgi:hypothetical protein
MRHKNIMEIIILSALALGFMAGLKTRAVAVRA